MGSAIKCWMFSSHHCEGALVGPKPTLYHISVQLTTVDNFSSVLLFFVSIQLILMIQLDFNGSLKNTYCLTTSPSNRENNFGIKPQQT